LINFDVDELMMMRRRRKSRGTNKKKYTTNSDGSNKCKQIVTSNVIQAQAFAEGKPGLKRLFYGQTL